MPTLSVVTPMHDEARTAVELLDRINAAVRDAGVDSYEVVVVDDASTDDTAAVAAACGARVIRMAANVGQFRATLAGIRAATGTWVAVLDGDLQDPPEALGQLLTTARLRANLDAGVDVVFAVKVARYEQLWMRTGAALYHAAQRLGGAAAVPAGAGSYCIMSAAMAGRVGRVRLRDANLAAVLTALGAVYRLCPYTKQARGHGSSRVGPRGLIREAVGSLAVTGVAARLGVLGATVLGGIAWWIRDSHPVVAGVAIGSALACAGLGVVGSWRARTKLHG